MICEKCKKEIANDALFCQYCGKKQHTTTHNVKKRGNGQGTVYKRPDGKWTAQVTLGYYYKDGKKMRKAKQKYGFKTKKEAVQYIETLRNANTTPKIITISNLWELFCKNSFPELSNSKRTAYNVAYRKIQSSISWRTIDSFSVSELQDIVDSYGNSFYTCRDIKSLLSHLYKIAIQDDYVEKNKARFVKLPPLQKSERIIFNPKDIDTLWSDYNANKEPITAHMLIMLYTGIRPGELLTITTDNIHLSEHFMTGGIKTAKGKARKIIIPDKIKPIMEHLLKSSKKSRLAYYPSPTEFYEAWQSKRQALGLNPMLTPYCCRHTYITNLTALKVSPAMLQELAGHEDYETTLDYTHLSVADRLAEVNKL